MKDMERKKKTGTHPLLGCVPVLAVCIVVTLIVCSGGAAFGASAKSIAKRRPSHEKWCFDYARVLPANVEEDINDEGRSIQKAFDVDFVVAIVPDLGGRDINRYAVDMFSNWEIGKSTQGKKGILILIAKKEQRTRIEVGYDLEGIYTDAYVGQVEREILKEFLEQAEWGVGFSATIENFVFRIYNKDMKTEVKSIKAPDKDLDYYSQGAGAQNVFDYGAALKKTLPEDYQEIKQYFSAQPTPDAAFQRYMELKVKMVKHNNDLTLFTDLSNKFWKGWKHTSGQSRAEAEHISGKPYIIKQKEDHAVVFFPESDPEKLKKTPMYYLFKADEGWQVDINTMTRGMRCVGPGWWMVTDTFHPYSAIILEEYNLVGGFLTPWNDSKAYAHFSNLDSYFYDKNEPGHHINVYHGYENKSQLKRGDSILSVNGEKVRDVSHFWGFFRGTQAGASFEMELLRDGRKMKVTETLGGSPDGFRLYRSCLKTPRQWIGVYMVQALDSEWRHTMKLRDQGKFRYSSLCSIIDIYPGSPADKAGLKPLDLIVHYGAPDDNGEIMPYDVTRHLYKMKPGETMNLTIVRDLNKIMNIKVTPEETMHRGYF